METQETIAERLEYLEDCMEEIWEQNERQKTMFQMLDALCETLGVPLNSWATSQKERIEELRAQQEQNERELHAGVMKRVDLPSLCLCQ
ncbi:hypothetical protein [Lactococcus lactis]|uniref:hypothetical protein n=1 Tax=Lactococcus lactis TaxID=1358 RepID=UPI003D175086